MNKSHMDLQIMLVEDHPLMQKGMQITLDSEPGINVFATASTAEEALKIAETKPPDLVIADISLPGINGLELIRILRRRHPDIRILVVSRHDEELYAERAVHAGAQGYIMKIHAGDQVAEAVRRIASGGIYLSESIREKILLQLSSGKRVDRRSPQQCLSDRELEVFRLMGQTKPTREIASRMHISPKTVDTYKSRIREKLNISDTHGLLQQAVQWVRENES